MANGDGSSNTAIVAILVIIVVLLGIFFFYGGFGIFRGADGDRTTNVIESPNVIERPATTPSNGNRR